MLTTMSLYKDKIEMSNNVPAMYISQCREDTQVRADYERGMPSPLHRTYSVITESVAIWSITIVILFIQTCIRLFEV